MPLLYSHYPVKTARNLASTNNTKGRIDLKGENPDYSGEALPDLWELNRDLREVAALWGMNPEKDLVHTHDRADSELWPAKQAALKSALLKRTLPR
jgi:hypothetical protein